MDNIKKNNQLAILGGDKVINTTFKPYNSIGEEEKKAAIDVLESGVLSKFLGAWHEDFYGGAKVREFERYCESYFSVKHAITMNSLTSGLIAAVGAVGIEPGDEVITSPWTMCATATAILHWNAIPVFADIESETFNLDSKSVEKNITERTKAIIVVDIFGNSADILAMRELADKYSLKLISDTAQAPNAYYHNKFAGTWADIGGLSLNYHKHIHTGEGGIMLTDNDEYAERMRLIRNHAEAVVGPKKESNLSNMIGYNFRLGEIESAIGIEQLKKLDKLVFHRQGVAKILTAGLSKLQGLRLPIIKPECSHVFYVYPMILDLEILGVSRACIYDALVAEGVQGLIQGYVNLHTLPMYQQKIAYGSKGFPWISDSYTSNISYDKGICPIAEELHESTFLGYQMCLNDLTNNDIGLIISAFIKVWNNFKYMK